MTQNLDLDLYSSVALTSNNTDLNVYNVSGYTDGYTESNGIIYWTPSSTANTINFAGTTVTDWQNSNTAPYSANKTDDTETGHASLGNYYNWTAAIASNDSSTLTSNTLNNIQNNPKNSICPKGWRLPTISSDSASTTGSTNEFARLNYLYNNSSTNNDANMLTAPLYFVRGGNVNPDQKKLNYVGVYGAYWSNTIKDGSNSYFMDLGNTEFMRPSSNLRRSLGFSVRCLAR